MAVYSSISLPEVIIWNSTILVIYLGKTMFIIDFTMILIVATIINIVFIKIGSILKRLKCFGKM